MLKIGQGIARVWNCVTDPLEAKVAVIAAVEAVAMTQSMGYNGNYVTNWRKGCDRIANIYFMSG